MHEILDRICVSDIEGQRDGIAAIGANLLDDLFTLLHPPRAQRIRKAMGGQVDRGGGADSR